MQTEPTSDHPGLFTPAFFADPYPTYRAIRELGSPYWFPYRSDDGRGMWLIADHADVDALLKETQRVTNNISPYFPTAEASPLEQTLLQSDPPEHTQKRKCLGEYYSKKKLKLLEARIERMVDDRIDSINALHDKRIDFVGDFAVGIPLAVSAELLGIPAADITSLYAWSQYLSESLDFLNSNESNLLKQREAVRSIQAYFARWLDSPHDVAEHTVSHALLQGHQENNQPERRELLATLMLLFIAGYENIANTLGNGLLALLQHPDQKRLLLEEPDRIDAAIAEMMRYDSSVQRANLRVAVDEIELGGRVFVRGEHLSPLLGAANRDPARFNDPDRFDITRPAGRHLSFGAGPHICPGASLARMQLRIVFTHLLQAWPDIRLAGDPPAWKHNSVIRGLQRLPVLLHA